MAARVAGDVDTVVISDVHLGADLVQHVRPWTQDVLRRPSAIDAPLVAMLGHIQQRRAEDVPLRLVIAGDFLELVGMSILPESRSSSSRSRAERRWGIGRGEVQTVLKMQAIGARHPEVMRALGQFVLCGHSIIVLRGNHDEDLYWPSAQAAFIDALADQQPAESGPRVGGGGVSVRDAIAARVHFAPWFFLDRGVYIEHGHRYDAMSSRRWFCAPTSFARGSQAEHDNTDEIVDTLGDVLIRRVINPTRDMRVHGHEGETLEAWLRYLHALGAVQSARLIVRAAGCVWWWARQRTAIGANCIRAGDAGALAREHEEVCREQARIWGLSMEAIERLAGLTAEPATCSVRALRRALSPRGGLSTVLARAAQSVVAICNDHPLQWVVMGHTHQPVHRALRAARGSGDSTVRYLNTGHWGPYEHAGSSRGHASLDETPSWTLGWFEHRGAGEAAVRGTLLRYDPENDTLSEWEDKRNQRERNRHDHEVER
jgi:UDP-2,3-diacylglucosamine pyrophosphatase LpxH